MMTFRTREHYRRRERRRFRNFSRNRPEMTNLNHQYAIRRVDMDLSLDRSSSSFHKVYRRERGADVNCFTIDAANASVNGGRFTAPVNLTMIAACEKSLRVRFLEMEA
jgi:hypothetical protein